MTVQNAGGQRGFAQRYIFVWAPKTGGSSIYQRLGRPPLFLNSLDGIEPARDPAQRLSTYDPRLHRRVSFGHVSIRRLMLEGILREEDWRESFTFAFVRNPWDRFVSLYHYLRVEQVTGMRMHEFVRYLYERREIIPPLGLCNNHQFIEGPSGRLRELLGVQFRPQSEWIPEQIDFLGRFENLDEDCRRIGLLPHGAHLGRVNASDHARYPRYYDAETAEMIGRMYAVDSARFGYRFEPASVRPGEPREGAAQAPFARARKSVPPSMSSNAPVE